MQSLNEKEIVFELIISKNAEQIINLEKYDAVIFKSRV